MSGPHRLVLAGCGGMGRRHLRGYRLLADTEPDRLQFVAAVDPELERARYLAGEAEQLLGHRPAEFRTLEEALEAIPELDVADIVSAVSTHHSLTRIATEAGLSVLCEKPMAPTVAACRAMQDAASAAGTRLSIAENYRRDPMSRLTRALLANGAIGEVRSLIDITASGGSTGVAGAWRYLRREGGPVLEAGVHRADLHLYLCGAIQEVSASQRLNEPMRQFEGTPVKAFHDHYSASYPEVQRLDSPDLLMATLELESGALGQWLYDDGAHGPPVRRFTIFGSEGQMVVPDVRCGDPPRVYRNGGSEPLSDAEALATVPDYYLDSRTASLFGGRRLARYDNAGVGLGGGADARLLAVELGELLDAIDNAAPVEIGPEEGLAAVAVVLACHESAAAGRRVSLREVLDGSLDTYQRPVDQELGLTRP